MSSTKNEGGYVGSPSRTLSVRLDRPITAGLIRDITDVCDASELTRSCVWPGLCDKFADCAGTAWLAPLVLPYRRCLASAVCIAPPPSGGTSVGT